MRSRFLIIFLALLASSPALAAPLKLTALGTSLTQGYGLPPGTEFTVQLQAALKAQKYDVTLVNAGVSGDTSADGLARLDWALADHPDAIILELGSNDMLRGLPPEQTETNLRAILVKLKAAHVRYCCAGMMAQRNLGADYVQRFDSIAKLAKETGVLFYPLHPGWRGARSEAQPGRRHASQSGGGESDRGTHIADGEKTAGAGELMFRRLLSVSGFTLLSRITGFVRDILMAAILGKGISPTPLSSPSPFPTIYAPSSARAPSILPSCPRMRH